VGTAVSVAKNLVAADPVTWQWYPVDYKPGFAIPDDLPMGAANSGSARRAINMVTAHILSNPNYVVVAGDSQGGMISDFLYEELRNPAGSLHSKYSNLLTVMSFGSPRRPHGHTLSPDCLAASGFSTGQLIDPVGQGIAGDLLYQMSFGTVPGVMASPPTNGEVQWFCNQRDVAADSTAYLNGNVENFVAAMTHLFWDGELSVFGVVGSIVQLAFGLLDISEWASVIDLIKQWWPFGGGDLGSPVGFPNPHIEYEDPYPYTGITGCTISGVTIATNYLRKLGAQYAAGPVVPVPKASYSWWQIPPD
jgi:hypothetical protein